MKEECRFIGQEIMDIIEDVDKIEGRLTLGTHWKVSIPHVNQQLDTVIRDTRDLADHSLISTPQYKEVEQAVGRLKAKLPATGGIELEPLSADQLGVILLAVDGVKRVLTDTLMESVVGCECGGRV